MTGLEEGTDYSVRVRARYHNGDGNVEESGPWSTSVEITVAAQPPPRQRKSRQRSQARRPSPPAKPTGLSTSPSHDSVLLSWTDPGDDTITGYQVLRGPDAANLAVLNDDTGNANASYTDATVSAETTYTYAIRAKNADGLGPQSDAVPAITTAASVLPAEPTGLLAAVSHDNVQLIWTDPGDNSITGYQVLRGPDAANLAVLTADTGSTTTSYTDDSVTAETTYIYAVMARNANGLSPQSDPFRVRTRAAPVEPEIALAVGGAELTLDGQNLDTTGTCTESDIAAISDACTINISETSVLLAISQALETGTSLIVKIGADATAAGEADNAATNTSFTATSLSTPLTFEVGPNLMLFIVGFGTFHYFQVNVEVTGATDATLSALALTDASNNAITLDPTFASDVEFYAATVANAVSQIKVEPTKNDTNATLQYLDSADTVLTDADTNTAVFDVDLAEGTNILKIKVTAEDTTTTVTYNIRIRRAETDDLVSNLGQFTTPRAATIISNTFFVTTTTDVAAMFTTGSEPDGYKLTTLNLFMSAPAESIPQISVYTDNSGEPGTSLKTLTNPDSIPTSLEEVQFDADNYPLQPTTSYWIVIEETSGLSIATPFIYQTTSSEEDPGSLPGWDIGNPGKFRTAGTWQDVTRSRVSAFALKGAVVTGAKDATLSNLEVFDTEPALASLTPAFDSAITEYTAVVANEHTSIELDAALNDQNATVQLLDENDVIIPIDSTVAPNISYILPNIEVGDNVFKVKVTAENTVTTKTYQVTVTRADFLVSNLGQTEDARNTVAIQNDAIAAQFTTGDNPAGYTINKITADMLSTSGGTPAVSIHSDNSGEPGSSLVTLTNPGTIPTTQTEIDFTATDYRVLPGTTYWVVFELTSSSGSIEVVLTESPSEDAGSAPNWSIGDNGSELASGTWSAFTPTSVIPKLAIKGDHASPTTPNEPTSLTTSPGNTEVTLAWRPLPSTVARPSPSTNTGSVPTAVQHGPRIGQMYPTPTVTATCRTSGPSRSQAWPTGPCTPSRCGRSTAKGTAARPRRRKRR